MLAAATGGYPVETRLQVRLSLLLICAAAIVPYLATVDDYFVRDDFGVVRLLSSKPATWFPRWFYTSWMENIWGYLPDEVRPFPALSYQITSLWGAASPVAHHVLNIGLHALNGVLLFAIAREAAGLSLRAAAFAGLVFVLLPVHTESVAWITGRVDSMPSLFYLATFLAYVRWRARGSSSRRLYAWSLAWFFVALFTKQNTITMLGTLVFYDLLLARYSAQAGTRAPSQPGTPAPSHPGTVAPSQPGTLAPHSNTVAPSHSGTLAPGARRAPGAPYIPFALMTAGYLGLRYLLFGQVARESTLSTQMVEQFIGFVGAHLTHVVTGQPDGRVWTWLAALFIAAAIGLALAARGSRSDMVLRLIYFGPVWWAIGVAPILVAGYHSPRHVYLAAAGWAVVLGLAAEGLGQLLVRRPTWLRTAGVLAVLLFYAAGLRGAVEEYSEMAAVSQQAVRGVAGHALAAERGALLIVGVPARSWEWVLPFAVQPPFTGRDATRHVFIVSPRALSCCRDHWFSDTKRALKAWAAGPASGTIVVLRWEASPGPPAVLRATEGSPVVVIARSLPSVDDPELLDANIRRLIDAVAHAR